MLCELFYAEKEVEASFLFAFFILFHIFPVFLKAYCKLSYKGVFCDENDQAGEKRNKQSVGGDISCAVSDPDPACQYFLLL